LTKPSVKEGFVFYIYEKTQVKHLVFCELLPLKCFFPWGYMIYQHWAFSGHNPSSDYASRLFRLYPTWASDLLHAYGGMARAIFSLIRTSKASLLMLIILHHYFVLAFTWNRRKMFLAYLNTSKHRSRIFRQPSAPCLSRAMASKILFESERIKSKPSAIG